MNCPQCGALVEAHTKICPLCGLDLTEDLSGVQAAAGVDVLASFGGARKPCPACGMKNDAAAEKCFACGHAFTEKTAEKTPEASAADHKTDISPKEARTGFHHRHTVSRRCLRLVTALSALGVAMLAGVVFWGCYIYSPGYKLAQVCQNGITSSDFPMMVAEVDSDWDVWVYEQEVPRTAKVLYQRFLRGEMTLDEYTTVYKWMYARSRRGMGPNPREGTTWRKIEKYALKLLEEQVEGHATGEVPLFIVDYYYDRLKDLTGSRGETLRTELYCNEAKKLTDMALNSENSGKILEMYRELDVLVERQVTDLALYQNKITAAYENYLRTEALTRAQGDRQSGIAQPAPDWAMVDDFCAELQEARAAMTDSAEVHQWTERLENYYTRVLARYLLDNSAGTLQPTTTYNRYTMEAAAGADGVVELGIPSFFMDNAPSTYSRLRGTLEPVTVTSGSGHLEIYEGETRVYRSPQMTAASEPLEIDLPVTPNAPLELRLVADSEICRVTLAEFCLVSE